MTSTSDAIDEAVKIFTVAVSIIINLILWLLAYSDYLIIVPIFQVTIVVVAVPEGLPLAVTLT